MNDSSEEQPQVTIKGSQNLSSMYSVDIDQALNDESGGDSEESDD